MSTPTFYLRVPVLAGWVLLVVGNAFPAVRLPAVISNNMVLQQQSDVALWGWAKPNEEVTIVGSWNPDGEMHTRADKEGKWNVRIKTPKAGGRHSLVFAGENTITVENVLVGEVWFCSGQSNMNFPVYAVENAEEELARADHPEIRVFKVARKVAGEPQDDCNGRWIECSPESVREFSAVAYFFGRELNMKLRVSIGLVQSSWGGTAVESWMPREILEADEKFVPVLKRFERDEKSYAERLDTHEKNPEGKPPIDPQRDPNRPAGLYNGMVAPVIPFTIKGFIWYQGESNVSRAYQYRTLFPAMVGAWRERWGLGDLPFYYVQIAPYRYANRVSPELREAQLMALSLIPNSGMVVTMDIGNPDDIHPKNKREVGRRLALWALSKDYRMDGVVFSGPLYKSMKVEDSAIRVCFNHVGSGLMARGGALTHFTIAGEDQVFVDAKAVIQGDCIVVSSSAVRHPVAIRYGWADEAEPNLFNRGGLPASPFRTDQWPGITDDRK